MKKRRIIIEVAIFLLLSILCLIAMTARKNREKVYTTEDNTLIINEGVEEIDYYDLIGVNKKRIKNIQLPSSLKRIGHEAFEEYEALTSVQLPDSLKYIDDDAFNSCWELDSIKIPNSVKRISPQAFRNTSIHQFVTYDNGKKIVWLGNEDSIPTSVTVPEGVEIIDNSLFMDNYRIQEIILPSTLKRIEMDAFRGCCNLKEVKGIENVDSIRFRAFNFCSKLNRLLCYNKGRCCLGWPGSDTPDEIIIPEGVESIDPYAFEGQGQIQKVQLPQSLKKIGKHAFYNCDELQKIELPDHLEYLGEDAFGKYGSKYTRIDRIPASLTYIGEGVLDKQPYNKVVVYANGTKCYGWVGQKDSIPASITIPQGVKFIDPRAFNHHPQLKEVIIPEGCVKIGEEAFRECYHLKRVELPKSLDTISSLAFLECKFLKEITHLFHVQYIAPDVWKYDYKTDYPDAISGLFLYADGKKCLGWIGEGCPDTLIIPQGVKIIDEQAFSHLESLKCIILPDGLETIEERAFKSCYDLSSITMPPSVRQIKEEAFAYCSKLKLNQLPDSLKEIGIMAFRGCDEITQVHIPQGVQKVKNSAFKDCHGLTSVTIPQGVKTIEREAFNGCSKLQNLEIGDDITEIGSEAFLNCDSLVSVKLPDSLTTIREYTFAGCNHLKEIHLPAALKEIEAMAFEGCPQLRMPKMGDNVQMHRDAFGKSFQTALLDFIRDCGWSIFWLLALLAAGLFIHKEYGWRNLLSKLETTSFTKILKVIGIIVAVIFVIILLGLFIIFLN